MKFYRLKQILSRGAQYNLIFGERSNGKTYACLEYALEKYVKTGKQTALVRRWREDFIGKRGASMFDGHVENGLIDKLTKGRCNGVYYFSHKWYLCRTEDGERVYTDEMPFCIGFALTSTEHDKSTSYPRITTIIFDEFLTRNGYIPDEFVLFMNLVSTIVRHRTDVTIFMLGNTVNKYSPYFKEMGLKNILTMNPGDIDVYKYGDTGLKVAVEYCKPNHQGKPSDVYFAFDNPKLTMITGGAWELDIYPHCPIKYRPKDILFTYFIQFNGETLQCEIVQTVTEMFTFIHRRTADLERPEQELIFSTDYSIYENHVRDITHPYTNIHKKIVEFFKKDKVFYQDNEVGDLVKNYLEWCGK